ncbi:MAG: ABC transporter permease [Thermodesulfobacteriota bacterium]
MAGRRRKITVRRPRSLVWGGVIVGFIVLGALLGPALAPFPYDEFHSADRLRPPNLKYWLGTDEFGRDVLSRTLFGARLSLFMGFLATTVSLVLGVPLGLLAGYSRGRLDEAIMRLMDLLMSFPPIILGLLVLAVTKPNLVKTAMAVGLVYVPSLVRVARSVTLDLVDREFVLAARARGERAWYILVAEILPNAWPPIIVEGSLRVTFSILLGAALSFLGMGAQPPSSDWGLMISEARNFLDAAPWIALSPGLAMCLTVVGVNLVGDGLREVLDPRLKHGGRM